MPYKRRRYLFYPQLITYEQYAVHTRSITLRTNYEIGKQSNFLLQFNIAIVPFLKVILVALLVAAALAAPQGNPDKDATILKSDFDNIGVGGYKYG